jgi:serine/threonine-protein kinase RsbW
MDDIDIVRLSVPGTLLFRDVVLRVVASFCKLVRSQAKQEPSPSRHAAEFDDKVVSAVGEAFNNVAIHAYRGRPAGNVEVELQRHDHRITVRLFDTGVGFEPSLEKMPDLATLPESHMGLFIMRSCMDTVSYSRGNPPREPNVLTMTKSYLVPPGDTA